MTEVTLVAWAPQHLPLLVEANSPEMTRYLGGPETDEEVQLRHERYLRLSREPAGDARMFAIEVGGEPAGGIGYWPIERDGEAAYETGWNVLPGWQGRGVASSALRSLVDLIRREAPQRRRLYAFPSAENAASNALCRGSGFADLGSQDFPFRGRVLYTCVWALDLRPGAPVRGV